MRLRLKAIRYDCDFRKSEVTLFQEFQRDPKFKDISALQTSETFLFVSCRHDQLVWLMNVGQYTNNGRDAWIVDSRKWRIRGGTWNPLMLGDYAKAVGIELVGIRMFADAYKEARAAKRQ